jgi:hypothetical protein
MEMNINQTYNNMAQQTENCLHLICFHPVNNREYYRLGFYKCYKCGNLIEEHQSSSSNDLIVNMEQQTLKMQQEQHITDIIRCFKLDPCASDYDKNYNHTEEYLWELIEKDGSVLRGIIRAMEKHLEK